MGGKHGGGETSLTSISEAGLLTGLEYGTVRDRAAAKDGSEASGSIDIKVEMTATNAGQIVDDMNIDDFSKMYDHSSELWMDKNGADYFGDQARLIRSNKYGTSFIRYAAYHYERISSFQITSYYQNYGGTLELPIEDIQFYVSPDGESWREVTGTEYSVEDKLLPRGEEGALYGRKESTAVTAWTEETITLRSPSRSSMKKVNIMIPISDRLY